MTALRQGVDSIAQARAKGGFTTTVGALPTVAARVIPKAIMAFKRDGVETTVRVVSGQNTVLLSQLRVGELDLVVGRLGEPRLMTGLSFEHLYSEQISFLVRPGHPLLQSAAFDLNRIRDFTVLVPIEGSIIRPFVDRFLIANGVGTPPDRVETVSMAFGRVYTRISDAIWIISSGVAANDVADDLLVELPVDTQDTVGPVGLTTRADVPPSLATQLLMQSVRTVAGEHREE